MMMRVLAVVSLLAAVACSPTADLVEKPEPLGDFSFGHNVVVAKDPVKGPLSRAATEEEWVSALETAIGTRFDQYEGDRLYHFGVSVQGYVLAQPGVPVVASPKSVLIVTLDVWDDAKGVKLNASPKQITALERISGETLVGSGLTQSKEQQMKNLSENAARLIKVYLEGQHKTEGWFVPGVTPPSETGREAAGEGDQMRAESGESEVGADSAQHGQTAGQAEGQQG